MNRPFIREKKLSNTKLRRSEEKASLPVDVRLVAPNFPAAAKLKTEKGLETRLCQERIICVVHCLKFE